MKISQTDYRTIKIEKDSHALFLRYSLHMNGQERLPESIASRDNHVIAYFLTATIRDCIQETEFGFSIERSWSVLPEADISLSIRLDFADSINTFLFPFIRAGESQGEIIHVSGEQTAYPCSVFIFSKAGSALIFSDPANNETGLGSIEMKRQTHEDESFLSVVLHFPPQTESSHAEEARTYQSRGNFEQLLRINIVVAPENEIYRQSLCTALARQTHVHGPQTEKIEALYSGIKSIIQNCLSSHLYCKNSIFGLRTEPGSSMLSSSAGAGMAFILNRLFTDEPEMMETSLKLADFSLKGQHPGGPFYEIFDLKDSSWKGLNQMNANKKSLSPPELSVEHAVLISQYLLLFTETLESQKKPAFKYLHAALRMVDSLFNSKQRLAGFGSTLYPDSRMLPETGPEILQLVAPLVKLLKRTGKDYYKKALSALHRHFFSNPLCLLPPYTDTRSALILVRSAAYLSEAGFKIKDLQAYISLLLPWIYINEDTGKDFNTLGGTCSSLSDGLLLFQGFEYSYTLLKLNKQVSKKKTEKWLTQTVNQLIGFTLQKPPGTACCRIASSEKEHGPVDSGRLVREIYYLLKLSEERLLPPG